MKHALGQRSSNVSAILLNAESLPDIGAFGDEGGIKALVYEFLERKNR